MGTGEGRLPAAGMRLGAELCGQGVAGRPALSRRSWCSFGATGDLARRKLLPGLFHLASAGFIPGCRIIGVSLDDLDADGFRAAGARGARRVLHARKISDADWAAFAAKLDYVPLAAGAGRAEGRGRARRSRPSAGESRRLHYLSVPPSAALPAVHLLGEAGLVERSPHHHGEALRHRPGQRGDR